MVFLVIAAALRVVVPLVILLTRVRGEVVATLAGLILLAALTRQLHFAALFNLLGWAMTIASFMPGLVPARLRRRVKVRA